MQWYALIFCLSVNPLAAIPLDLPTRTARQKLVPQDPPTIQALKVLNGFLQALTTGNSSQAYYAYGSRQFQDNVSFLDFKNFVQRFPSLSRNRAVKHDKEEYEKSSPDENAVTGDVMMVTSLLESYEGQRNLAQFILLFEAGQWRIASIKLFPAPANLIDN